MKQIRLSTHAKEQLHYRGIEESEVIEVMRTSSWELAKKGRFQAAKDFLFESEWNNKYYSLKQVKPIFV